MTNYCQIPEGTPAAATVGELRARLSEFPDDLCALVEKPWPGGTGHPQPFVDV